MLPYADRRRRRRRGAKGVVNVLVDGDCEADNVTAWPPARGGTVQKTTSSPYKGTRALHLQATGGDNKGALQSVCTVGHDYRLTGVARGDGTGRPGVYMTTTGYISAGTSSTSWQAIDATFTAQHTDIEFWCLDADRWADFDDLLLVDLG